MSLVNSSCLFRSHEAAKCSASTGCLAGDVFKPFWSTEGTYRGDPIEQLFDLEMDPGETDSEAAAILEAHRRMLREWDDQLDLALGVPYADYWRTDSS